LVKVRTLPVCQPVPVSNAYVLTAVEPITTPLLTTTATMHVELYATPVRVTPAGTVPVAAEYTLKFFIAEVTVSVRVPPVPTPPLALLPHPFDMDIAELAVGTPNKVRTFVWFKLIDVVAPSASSVLTCPKLMALGETGNVILCLQ
jgi:hypothetical protein